MRGILLIILVGGFFQRTFGQNYLDSCNRMIGKRLQNSIDVNAFDKIDSSGLTFIKISRVKDSIILNSIFYSAPQFNLENSRYLIHMLNRDYKNKLPENYEVYFPVYFNKYNTDDSLFPYPNGATLMLEKKMKEFETRNISPPVIIVTYLIKH